GTVWLWLTDSAVFLASSPSPPPPPPPNPTSPENLAPRLLLPSPPRRRFPLSPASSPPPPPPQVIPAWWWSDRRSPSPASCPRWKRRSFRPCSTTRRYGAGLVSRAMAPVISKLSSRYPKIPIYKVDIDMDGVGSKLSDLKIFSVPTFHFYYQGRKTGEVVGANATKLESTMESLHKQL
ncbi:Os06g0665900, partial [Oryza sativa Japonica Group]